MNNRIPLKHQSIDGPWKRIQIDFIGLLPRTGKGNEYCLVIIDPFTKWIEAIPTRNCTSKTTARVLLNEIFSRYGLPSVIDSDQGSHFTAEIIKQLCVALGVRQHFHIAGHPQSSGLVECSNRVLKTALRKVVETSGKQWDVHLPLILMAIRSTVGAHSYTPYEVLFGRLMRTPELWWVEGGVPPEGFHPRIKTSEYLKQLLETLSQIQQSVAVTLKGNIQKMDKRLSEELKFHEWSVGDKVLYRHFSEKSHPLSPRWMGPCYIINKAGPTVYQIEIHTKKNRKIAKWFHSSQLKEWKGN